MAPGHVPPMPTQMLAQNIHSEVIVDYKPLVTNSQVCIWCGTPTEWNDDDHEVISGMAYCYVPDNNRK